MIMSGATAQATEPAVKMPMLASIMARRPWMSLSFPYNGATTVELSR